MNTSNHGSQDYRAFMIQALSKAMTHFLVATVGRPVFGWHVGSQARNEQEKYWLRVVAENKYWVQKDWWQGNEAANEIEGVSKP